MASVNLNSEGFEKAAYTLSHAMDRFRGVDTNELVQIVNQLESQVTRLRDIFAMQAENMQRQVLGQSMAYTEKEFYNV